MYFFSEISYLVRKILVLNLSIKSGNILKVHKIGGGDGKYCQKLGKNHQKCELYVNFPIGRSCYTFSCYTRFFIYEKLLQENEAENVQNANKKIRKIRKYPAWK